MGFFNDLKEDLASAVNELTDEKAEREIELSSQHMKDEIARFDREKKNKKEKKPNENLEREIQNILNGIDENVPVTEETVEENIIKEDTAESGNIKIQIEKFEEFESDEAEEISEQTKEVYEEIVSEEIKDSVPENPINEKMTEYRSDEDYDFTVISKETTVKGGLESSGSIEINGVVEGDVKAGGELILNGTVNGDVEALILSVNYGKIRGNVKAYNGVYISEDSILIGDIESTEAEIGGAVKGKIDVNGPVVLKTGAKVLGDIDCKSVQINNGAVIEGKCSQKYADVSPSAFFENL